MDIVLMRFFSPLFEAVRETFETFAFCECSDWRILESRPPDMEEVIGAGIRLLHPIHGQFALFLKSRQCRTIVETLYDREIMESDDASEILDDFLRELVNTIAGRFAAANAEVSGTVHLGLPETIHPEDVSSAAVYIAFDLEGVTAHCRLEVTS